MNRPAIISNPARWLAGATGTLVLIALGLRLWIDEHRSELPLPRSPEGRALTFTYNMASHAVFVAGLGILVAILMRPIVRNWINRPPNPQKRSSLQQLLFSIKRHPAATALFAACTVFMVSEASWFYKEIVGWYDDIYAAELLNTFSLRMRIVRETMERNDYRFYPLAFQDLQLLSWITPYVKVWMLANVAELITTIALGVRIVRQITSNRTAKELLLVFSLLFIFIAPSAYSYFQFIYSERILTLLFAAYLSLYIDYKRTQSKSAGRGVLVFAVLGIFVKDIAFVLFLIPPAITLGLSAFGRLSGPNAQIQKNWSSWCKHHRLELHLLSLALLFGVAFVYLAYLPSHFVGEERYDAAKRLTEFQPDLRLLILTGFSVQRITAVLRQRSTWTMLDAANLACLGYVGCLFYLVGYRSNSYMSLPVQFIAVIDILVIWVSVARPWLNRWVGEHRIAPLAVALSSCLIAFELLLPDNFYVRIRDMTLTHRSWASTYREADSVLREARASGQPVNLIFSKSWFRRFDHLKRLKYDRLIYLNEQDKTYLVMDGVGKGGSYTPQKGDFFLDIDAGSALSKKFNVDLSEYKEIYRYSPRLSNGRLLIKE